MRQERGSFLSVYVFCFCLFVFYDQELNFDGNEMIYINTLQQIREMMTKLKQTKTKTKMHTYKGPDTGLAQSMSRISCLKWMPLGQ